MHPDLSTVALSFSPKSGRCGDPIKASPRSGLMADPLGVEGVKVGFGRNEEIFGEGEPAACVYRMLSGVVRTYRILADGRRQISDFYLPGDVFGLEAGADHRISAESVSDCEVLAIRRSQLGDKAMNEASTAHKLWALTLHHLRRSEEHMLVLGCKNACEKLAWFLMDMSLRIPAPDRIELPVSRQDIADFLGLTIETVSRTMTQLQDDEVIALPSCRQVVMRDKQALEDLAS
jgi:CRP/FNR family transcriptional regulator, nitrogen fixation regulation protein